MSRMRGTVFSLTIGRSGMARRPRIVSRSVPVLTGILLAGLGCRDEADSPTAPQLTPVLETSAATSLVFDQVSAGGFHTCGVTTGHQAYCWGRGSDGELGTGAPLGASPTPVLVQGGLQFRQISVSGAHTCAVTTGNRAYCWGDNFDGAVGDGTTTDRRAPVPVAGGLQFIQVDAGSSFTCGLTYPDRKAYCWGSNGSGTLGDGTHTSRLRPVPVAGDHRFRLVRAGSSHTCGVTTSNQAYCWGWNRFGQIGDGGSTGTRLQPVPVAGGYAFRELDAGVAHTCGVTTDRRAFCWGYGKLGQLGDGDTKVRFRPRAVAGGLLFTRVSTGSGQTCGEAANRRAYCWGSNENGGLGDGTHTRRLKPVAVVGGLEFSQLSSGGWHACGKTPAGVAYCWGRGGNLGEGSDTDQPRPVPVAGTM